MYYGISDINGKWVLMKGWHGCQAGQGSVVFSDLEEWQLNQIYDALVGRRKSMEVTLGKEGLEKTWQAEFPETTSCCKCKGVSRIGFVAHENMSDNDSGGPFVLDQHPNKGKGGYWLHDACAVAVYFCRECLETTALYNQG